MSTLEHHSASSPGSVQESGGADHATGIVPLEARRGPVFMGLLWITMVTGLTTLSLGLQFHDRGLGLVDTLKGCVAGAAMLLVYTVIAAFLGAATGQTYALLTRSIFGKLGSYLVSAILVVISLGWFGFQAAFLARLLDPLLGFGGHLLVPTAVCALLMGITNYFGFSGVANYARYVAAPVLILLVLASAVQITQGGLAPLLAHVPPVATDPTSVVQIAGLVMGFGIWGNEPDFWRFGRPDWREPILPLAIAMATGLVLFPLVGWGIAALAGAHSDHDAALYLTRTVMQGAVPLAVLIFGAIQISNNDPNLYEAVNALENVTQWPRRAVVVVLWAIGIAAALGLGALEGALFLVSGITSVLVPTATVIMAADCFLVPRLYGVTRQMDRVPTWSETAEANVPGILALVAGALVGVYTNGSIPGFGPGIVGIPPLQAWGVALVVYLLMVSVVRRSPRWLGHPGS
jgi:purine-cytosine permease-like protein